jgi:CubicO group peptidase (beta-lactamase class C family)
MKEARENGLSPERLERLAGAIRRDIEAEKYDGGVITVARHGVIGIQEAFGLAERAANRPCRLDDVFNIMSVTKAFTDVVIFTLIESGAISLVTRVCDIIPGFRGGFKEQVTVFHLLTHSAGSPPVFYPVPENLMGDNQAVAEACCKLPLTSAPGLKVAYSCTWGHSLLGEIIRRVDGGKRALRDIYRERLFGPLKMNDTALGRRRDLAPRIVPIVTCGHYDQLAAGGMENLNNVITEDAEIPAWGAVSTINDMFRFGEMLRRGGELDGARLLSPTTIAAAAAIQTGGMENEGLYEVFVDKGWPPEPLNIGLDFTIRGPAVGSPIAMGSLTSPRAFGKFGAGSTGVWVDPEWDITFVFMSVGLIDEYENFFRFHRLSDMAMAAVV